MGCSDLDGVDLLAVARGEPTPRRLGLVADNWSINKHGAVQRDQVAVFDGRYKLMLNRITGAFSMENQRLGGARGNDFVARYLQAVKNLKLVLDQYLDESEAQDPEDIDDEIDLSQLPVQH